MSVNSFDNQKIIHVSDSAQAHFAKRVRDKSANAIRFTMKEAGCTGYKYQIDEVESLTDTDIVINLANDVVIGIDHAFLSHYQGLEIDYVKEGLNSQLVLNNPNVKNACGCGESVGF